MVLDSAVDFANIMHARLEKVCEQTGVVLSTVRGEMSERIFNDGENENGGKIGRNSTKKFSLSDKRLPKNKQGTYKGGYAEFKKQRNRTKAAQSGYWDLFFTGDLRREFDGRPVERVGDCAYEVQILGQGDKIDGLRKRSGSKIFAFSKKELERLKELQIKNVSENLLN